MRKTTPNLHPPRRPKPFFHLPQVIICSDDLLGAFESELLSLDPPVKVVICDESHYLKSVGAARTKTALQILALARRVILLRLAEPPPVSPSPTPSRLLLSPAPRRQGPKRSPVTCVIHSGTPALSRPIELFTQVNALLPGLFGSYSEFGYRYCDGS